MYQNYIFDLYGTLVDIRTDEWQAQLWKKLQILYGYHGASYAYQEIKQAYGRLIDKEKADYAEGIYSYTEEFIQSPFFQFYNKLLNDERLLKVAGAPRILPRCEDERQKLLRRPIAEEAQRGERPASLFPEMQRAERSHRPAETNAPQDRIEAHMREIKVQQTKQNRPEDEQDGKAPKNAQRDAPV